MTSDDSIRYDDRLVDEVRRGYNDWAARHLADFDSRLMAWLLRERPDAVADALDWFEQRNDEKTAPPDFIGFPPDVARRLGAPDLPGEVIFENGFDVDGGPVDPRGPSAVRFETHTRGPDGEVTRTYGERA